MTMFLWRFSYHTPHTKENLASIYLCFLFVYVSDDESQHIVLARGVVFRADAQGFVDYDAGRRVAVSRITSVKVAT